MNGFKVINNKNCYKLLLLLKALNIGVPKNIIILISTYITTEELLKYMSTKIPSNYLCNESILMLKNASTKIKLNLIKSSLPKGSASLPKGSASLPKGSASLPKGSASLPKGSAYPKGPKLTQRVRKLTQRVRKLTQRVRKLTQRVRKLTQRVRKLTQRVRKFMWNKLLFSICMYHT